jgi:hypothetical protein
MRKITRALTGLAAAALTVGMAGPALAAGQARPVEQVPAHAAFQPGSGRPVIDWNRELISLLGTPGLQPATIHPTRSFAILQGAEYDAVVSITHVGQPYLFSVPAPRDARPDAAADQAAHDVLTSLYPAAKSSAEQLLAAELGAIPTSQGKRDGIRVGADVARLVTARRRPRRPLSQAPGPVTIARPRRTSRRRSSPTGARSHRSCSPAVTSSARRPHRRSAAPLMPARSTT